MKKTQTESLIKRLLTVTAAAGLLALGASVASANDLYNPDLNIISVGPQVNASPDGWQIVATKTISGSFNDGADSESWCNGANDPLQDGTGWGLFFKPFQGSTNNPSTLDDLLSVYFYQDNPSSPGTKYTLSAYAMGQANYSGYQTGAPNYPGTGLFIEFLDASGTVLADNQYDLAANGLSNVGDPVPSVQFTTPQFTAPPLCATVRVGAYMTNVWSTTGAQSLTMDDFDLESVAPPGSPVITSQPNSTTVSPGGTAHFTVVATPAPTSYVWTLNGNPLSGSEFSGQGTATLTITGASAADVGHYRVLVANGVGSVYSLNAPLALNGIYLFPTVALTGTIGDTYAVQRAPAVTGPWTSFTTNKLTKSPQYISDFTLPVSPNEFYQSVFLH